MIWQISGLRTAFLALVAVLSLRLCQNFPLFFPVVLFLGIAYSYRVFEWVRWRSQSEPSPRVPLPWHSWREGFNGLIIFFVSLWVAVAIASLVTGGTLVLVFSLISAFFGDSFTPELAGVFGRHAGYGVSQSLSHLIFPCWFAVAICLYRYESWAQQRRYPLIPTPPCDRKVKPAPVDSVDLELDHLRGNSGLTRMKARQPRKLKP